MIFFKFISKDNPKCINILRRMYKLIAHYKVLLYKSKIDIEYHMSTINSTHSTLK